MTTSLLFHAVYVLCPQRFQRDGQQLKWIDLLERTRVWMAPIQRAVTRATIVYDNDSATHAPNIPVRFLFL